MDIRTATTLRKKVADMKIVTSNMCPPIPVRDFDWCAHYEGEEEAGNYGWGATEAEAIQDFKDNCQDDHDERLGIALVDEAQSKAAGK